MTSVIGHTLGYPRIGVNRELKYALEQYWRGDITQEKLFKVGRILRLEHWKQQKNAGMALIPVGDFAWYDHVLTTSFMVDNIPIRHRIIAEENNNLDVLFRMSRGFFIDGVSIAPSEMKKWFNTNYHYIVPEFLQNQDFRLNWKQLLDEVDEALSYNYEVKPVLLGPISYLWLGKVKEEQFDRLSLLPNLLSVYQEILSILANKGINWVQIDEPVLVLELPYKWLESYLFAYSQLYGKVKLLLTTYFDGIYHQMNIIKQLSIDGVHVDLVSSIDNIPLLHQELPKDWVLSAGVVNGRNIWKTDLYGWFKKLIPLVEHRALWIGSSCSLLHSPIDLSLETKLIGKVKSWFAFSVQKCFEIKMLCDALNKNYMNNSVCSNMFDKYYHSNVLRAYSSQVHDPAVQKRCKSIDDIPLIRTSPYSVRSKLQINRFGFPLYPTTTIGSFPQTKEIRNLRLFLKNGNISEDDYRISIKKYIRKIIIAQEKLDLDVLVHGEPERNDMVEYFGEHLNGFVFTQHGWIQSYGSRCVKPPVIIGDVSRSQSITTEWIGYAQSLTKKPVKGILTGPVTIMSWSFLREDIKRNAIALQLALSIRDEVMDLEESGIGIIQIDEPALREGLPLKVSEQIEYLEWAVKAFQITVSSVKDDTQVHTHMCYSEFNDIIHALIKLDVDVISIESSRTDMRSLQELREYMDYLNNIGLGVYDIHSPNIPTKDDFINKLHQLLQYIPRRSLWINPDCGLKTRSWNEVRIALSNMVSAAKLLRLNYIN